MLKWIVSILLVLTPAIAQAWIHGTTFVEPTGSVSIPVSSQVNGAISANNWTGFTSPAGTVFTASTWGAANTKYLESNDFHTMVATTTAIARDVEVTTYVRDGTVFLRQSNGTAIYCRHNADGGTTGFFEFGAVDGLVGNPVNSGGSLVGSYHVLYQTLDMAAAAAGYDKNNTAGATLTCGVSGITIYAKFNGTVFASVLSNYDVTPGPVGLWANNGLGFRDVTVNYLPLAPLFSSPGLARWDPRDWGLKQGQTTGSITGGTPTLTLAASLGVVVGDGIIVATGGESGAGARGTVGVGGNSPVKSYANAAAMNADTGQPNGSSAWTQDNGQAFVTTGGVWARGFTYYSSFTSPRALLANVTGVSNGGLTLTLDTNATTTTTNAAVYVNNYSPVNAVLNPAAALPALSYQIVTLPCGNYAFGAPMGASFTPPMALTSKTGWRILGQGSCTTLMSPAGATSMGFTISQSPSTEIAYINIVGNNLAAGFGAAWSGNSYFLADPKGIQFNSDSDNSTAHDFTTTNTFYSGIAVSFGINVTAYNCTVTQNFVPTGAGGSANGDIEPYHLEWSDSTGGGPTNCTFTAPLLTGGYELFRSNGVVANQITLNNGYVSLNSAGGGFQINDLVLNLGVNTQSWYQATGALIDINNNIGSNPGVSSGGALNRPTVSQAGLYDGTNILPFVNVGASNPNITFAGTYTSSFSGKGCFSSANWSSGMISTFQGIGVRSDGTGTAVSGMRFIGQADYAAGHGNLHAEGGTMTSTNNIMDNVMTGPGAGSETGTESNATWNAANPGHTGC